ncbi:MAG: amino acid ABC transporter permease [bacterium]|nr:amino acid ABC transporter permease [bacterium]MDE0240415.1 amino acid ABC transporter permease [bacterium]MDE0415430.1 amino acid ABC transporter permease [bacterium]
MDLEQILKYAPLLLEGLKVTIIISTAGILLSIVTGAVLVAMQRSGIRPLAVIVRIYTEIILGIPILVLLYVIYFVLPDIGLRLSELAAGLLTLTLYYSPYMAEIMRGAIDAIPSGQLEAARSVGMSRLQAARRITVPQALGLIIPPLTGISIGLVKDSAILSIISVHEFAFETKQVVARTYAPFEFWTFAAICYWTILFVWENGMRSLERRVTRYREAR